jgi:hypothetical protein
VSVVVVDHPDEWIGIPEKWPASRWETPYEWASGLVDALREDWGVPPDGADITFRDVIVALANSLDRRVASRLYVSVDGWSGPIYVAGMAVLPPARGDGMTAAELAGATDDETIDKPIVGEFTTNGGVVGASCVRYFLRDDPGRVVARADFVVKVGDSFVDFFHEDADLVDFERALPRLRELAATVSERR